MNHKNYWPLDDSQSDQRCRELVKKLKESTDRGVAFFGAGSSVPAGFPNWTEFHERFLAHFEAQSGQLPTHPNTDTLIDVDYHTSRDPEKALAFVKDTFGVPISDIPSIVGMTRATRSLRYFYTTNFDEILYEVAAGEDVATYPNYVPMNARFVYLHGRASTATSIHSELVLGASGYDLAYGQSDVSQTKSQLVRLASYPVIFIGCSMSDQFMARSLEQTARAARYRRVRPIDREDEEAISPLDWFILLRAPPCSDPGRDEVKRSSERRLSDMGLSVIWYRDGGEPDRHRALLEVVQRIHRESRDLTVSESDPSLVERLIEAEDVASLASPTSSQLRRARAILEGHPRVASTFLSRVDGLDWFRGLRDAGCLQPKTSFVTATGEQRAPRWLAVGFLQRVASVAPAEVKNFLLNLEIDNWFAIQQALQVLEALDEESGAELGTRYARWAVEAMAVDNRTLLQVSRTASKLSLDGKLKAARELVRATILELANVTLTLSEGDAARFSESVAPVLAQSESGLTILEDARAIALVREWGTPAQDNVRYSRPAIEAHRMNLPERSIVGLLIDVTRETLLKTDNAYRRSAAVKTLLRSQWPTERRIGIAHCFLKRPDFPANEEAIVTKENLADPNLFHELAKLLVEGAEDLSNQASRTLQGFVETLHKGTTKLQRYDYILWASILPAALLPEPRREEEGDDDDRESYLFRDFYISRTFAPGAPMDKASFTELAGRLSTDKLLDLVREPESAGVNVTWRHNEEAMWSLLAEYAMEQGTLEPLLSISVDDIGRHGVWTPIEAMPEIAGGDSARWEEILDWTDGMVPAVHPDRFWPLGLLLRSSAKAAPIELSARVRALAMDVAERARRIPVLDSENAGDSLLDGFLNHPAGMAVHAIFELLHRELVESEGSEKNREKIPEWFSQDVLDPIARDPMVLGVDAWIGLGRFYPLLSVRAPDSVRFVASQLGSESPDHSVASNGFWSGYLWAPLVSSNALRQLHDTYRAHASILEQTGVLEGDLRDRFFQHLVIGVLREIPGYDDLLISTLHPNFSSETRGSIAFSLGRSLHEGAEEADKLFRQRTKEWFVRYWTEHVDSFGGGDGPQLAKYLLWLCDLDLPPSEIADIIEASLAQAESSFDVGETFRYLVNYVEEEPHVVLRLLDRCVEWYKVHGDFWLDSEGVRSLLHRIAPLTSTDPTLREVVEAFTELGALATDDVRTILSRDLT